MKRLNRLLISAVLAAGFADQNASAGILFTNSVENIQARNVRATLATNGVASGETYSFVNGAIRNQYVYATGAGGQTGKAWIQFDLSSIWALYGQTNLTDAKLWLWNQNGTSRQFWVAGIADGAGLEGWDQNTLTWSNAPANDYFNPPTIGYGFDYSKCYAGTNIWEVIGGAQGIDVSTPAVGQGALYISTNSTVKVKGFLESDTDGKVTMAISDGPPNSNQTIPIGTNGLYASDPLAPNGLPTRDSPRLVMIFDVRVALTGGGAVCPGDPGEDVSMYGTDAGYDYHLYTNGVYTGLKVTGDGTAKSFGLQTVEATYTAVSSNTTTTVMAPVPGTVVISVPVSPSFTVQPASINAATNSVALFKVTAVGDGGGYQWYRNGTALTDDGHYSGTTTPQLIINPVLASDAATTVDGYYCRIQNLCSASAFSTTNALTIQAARNLVWNGTPTNAWDIATTANWWLNTAGGTATDFNPGDNVTLDENGVAAVVLSSSNLAPGVITFNSTGKMGISDPSGTANIFGPHSSLVVNGPTGTSQLTISNANSFAGGVTINDGWLTLRNNFSVGTNIITMAGTIYSLLEVVPTGAAGNGIAGLYVTADSYLQVNGNGSTAIAILGPIDGIPGKKLKVTAPSATPGNNLRLYGNFTCNNDIDLDINGANWASYQSGTTIYNGVLSGNGVLYPRGGNTILNGANTFSYTLISQGNVGVGIDSALPASSPLGLGTFTQDNQGDNGIFAVNGARTIENPFTWLYRDNANRSFTTLGSNQLTMSGAFDLSGGTNNVIRTFNIGNTAPTILSGVIGDSGQNMGINKTGNGALYLNNAGNSYGSTTIISAGVLAGSGNVPGSLVVSNGAVGGGSAAAIGTLSVGGNVTFNGGGAFIRVNRSGLQCDKVSVSGTLANSGTGTITVTNLGAALQTGDNFVLFPGKTVTGGSTLTVTGAGMLWTNKLALDGSIEVLGIAPPPVNPNPTNITVSVSDGQMTISWPSDHIGWLLQSNGVSITDAGAWVTIPDSGSTTQFTFPVNVSLSNVYFRMLKP